MMRSSYYEFMSKIIVLIKILRNQVKGKVNI